MGYTETVLAAWDNWLGAQTSQLSLPLRYKLAPPWPYTGAYPYIIILSRTQNLIRYSNKEVYYSGYWRLMYVDLVGANFSSIGSILEAAGDWGELLISTLQSNDDNRSLYGQVDYVGEGPETGFIVNWDEKRSFLDTNNTPGIGLPIDVFVRGLPQDG